MERLLLVKRYSGDDETGVLERQHAQLEGYAAEHGGPIAGWVEDETVSGSVNLDERKSLGDWMKSPKLDDWDVMVVTEQDRVTRDDLHWWVFVGKLIEWGKRLVVLDDPQLDLSTPNGRMVAGIKATQAANYRLDVKKKLRNAREAFRAQRRYVGGHWPYGYRAEPREEGDGWKLVPDVETSERARELVTRVILGDSMREIARDFNHRGIPTGRDHQTTTAMLKPGETRKEPRGYKWNESTVKKILRNPTLLGFATHHGEVLREDGLPVQWAEPIVEVDEFKKVQEILDERGGERKGVRSNRSPLLGVVYCKCERPMHYLINRGYKYYRCASVWKREKCEYAVSWPLQMVQDYFEDRFLEDYGDDEIQTKTYVPGKNRQPEIDSLTEAIEHLSGNLANLPPGSRAAKSAIDKISEYEAKLDELEAEPTVPATWKYRGTGLTFRQRWEQAEDWHSRGAWLLRSGVKAEFGGTPMAPELHLFVPEDLRVRLQDVMSS